MKKTDSWSIKLILLFTIAVVLLLGYSTAVQAADSSEKNEDTAFLDPFTLTSMDILLGGGPNEHANERAKVMVPYRGQKRSPVKPPWP